MMAAVMIDSNVLLDILTKDPRWYAWSAAAVPKSMFEREPIPFEAAFLAGKSFLIYRRRGGTKRSPLPDFFIGAHAAVAGYQLLTRDTARYRTYFPKLQLITPN